MKVNPINPTIFNQYRIDNNHKNTNPNNTGCKKSDIAALEQLGRSQVIFGARDIMQEFSQDDLLYIDDTAKLYNFSEHEKKKFAEGIYDAFKYTDTKELSDFIINPADNPTVQRKKMLMRQWLYEFINDSMEPDEQTAQNIYNSMQTRLDNTGTSYLDYRLTTTIASMYLEENEQFDTLFSTLDQALVLGGYSSYFDIFNADSDKKMQSTISRYLKKTLNVNEGLVNSLIADFMVTADEPKEYRYSKLKMFEENEEIYSKISMDTVKQTSMRNAFSVNNFIDEFYKKKNKSLPETDIQYLFNAFFTRFAPEECPYGMNKDINEIAEQVSKRLGLPKGSKDEIVHILKVADSLSLFDILMINNIVNNARNPQKESNAINWNHNGKNRLN